MRRLFPLFILLVSVMVVLAPVADAAVPATTAWQEGAYFRYHYRHNVAWNEITAYAVKTTDAAGVESSTLTLSFFCKGYVSPTQISVVRHDVGPVTIPIPGDPDHVAVSRDLGWAGLDTIVQVYDRATASMIPIEIHLDWYAISPVTVVNGEYRRPTVVEGRITSPLCAFDFPRQPYIFTYEFSTRRPRPYYG